MTQHHLWRDWYNAELYHDYVHEYPIYRELNDRLVELSEISEARRVLDLGSGSGATTRACLPDLHRDAEMVGVDVSEAMVEVARTHVRDPRVRFEVASAPDLGDAVGGSFDHAVCNAAFWQFSEPQAVLEHLARLLEPGALFVFNVPAERVVGEASEVHPFQIALLRAIEAQTDPGFFLDPIVVDPVRLESWLDAAGFELEWSERFVYTGQQEELIELMRLPAMIVPLTPRLSTAERQAVVARAGDGIDPEQAVDVPWIYFGARRR